MAPFVPDQMANHVTAQRRTPVILALAGSLVLLAGCDGARRLADDMLDRRSPRERYVDALASAGLSETALAGDWNTAGSQALATAPVVTLPYVEEGYLAPAEPTAIGVRARVRRGQEVRFSVEFPVDSTATIFVDAWMVEADSTGTLHHLQSADSGARTLVIRPRQDADIVLRAQPELLRGGRFRVSVQVDPTLAFPVRSGHEYDVGSRWGASRDGGARRHQGIDIFAKRGTPVVAAAPGIIRRVEETPIGGRVVWQRDEDGNSLYYAHLDRQVAVAGMTVKVGDTLGFVGNTGNARTTPPHLHFGVYQRGSGAVDPWWFVHRPRGRAPQIVADSARFGGWVRVAQERTRLRVAPDERADTLPSLPRLTAMRVLSATGAWYRVRLPDGATGFVAVRLTEPADQAVRVATSVVAAPMLAWPSQAPRAADVLTIVPPGDSLDVLGRFGEFILVRSVHGVAGWMAEQ